MKFRARGARKKETPDDHSLQAGGLGRHGESVDAEYSARVFRICRHEAIFGRRIPREPNLGKLHFSGTPVVPTRERRTLAQCYESLLHEGLTAERLKILQYALTFNRRYSRYAGWTDSEVAEMLAYIDERLPASQRLRHPDYLYDPEHPERQPGDEKRERSSHRQTLSEIPVAAAPSFERFARSLPNRPYVSNDLERFGLQVRGRGIADLYRYVQHNQPSMCRWLVIDCDYPGALDRARAKRLPLPTYSAVNPENGHSHLLYELRDPVCTSDLAHWKPLNLLRRIEYQLREELEGDPGYGGFICKNVLNEHWQTEEVNPTPWGLLDFQKYLELPKRLPKKANTQGLGRNCSLFEIVRREAYASVLEYRLAGALEAFTGYIQAQVIQHNSKLPTPLASPEVRSIAKSIANWTWKNYIGRLSDEEFSKRQQKRGALGGKAKGQANAEKRAEALKMASEGAKQQAIADALGVSKMTISRWLRGV